MEKMHVCTCNNCGQLFEDINPSKDSILFDASQFVNIGQLTHQTDEGGSFIGCPECESDVFLMDNFIPIANHNKKPLAQCKN